MKLKLSDRKERAVRGSRAPPIRSDSYSRPGLVTCLWDCASNAVAD